VSPTSATAIHDTSTCSNVRLSRCRPRFHATGTPVGAKAPADDSSGSTLDGVGTSFGSLDHTPLRRLTEGVGTVRSWWGVSIDDPSHDAPSSRLFRRANEEEEPASDAPCRGAPGPKPLKHRQNRFPRPLVKETDFHGSKRLFSTGAHSLDAFAPGSNVGPPPVLELCRPSPASDALSPFAHEEEGLDSAASARLSPRGRTAPRAARRLLQSKRSTSTTWGPTEPFASLVTPDFRRALDRLEKVRELLAEPRNRVVTGQGPVARRLSPPHPAPLVRACARRELCPNPIGSNTSCR
jgi:hypothetical protein